MADAADRPTTALLALGALAAAASGIAVTLPLEWGLLLASDSSSGRAWVEGMPLGPFPSALGLAALVAHGALLWRAKGPGALRLRMGLPWTLLGLLGGLGAWGALLTFPPELRAGGDQPGADLGGLMLGMVVIAGEAGLAALGLLLALSGGWSRHRAASRPR